MPAEDDDHSRLAEWHNLQLWSHAKVFYVCFWLDDSIPRTNRHKKKPHCLYILITVSVRSISCTINISYHIHSVNNMLLNQRNEVFLEQVEFATINSLLFGSWVFRTSDRFVSMHCVIKILPLIITHFPLVR